MTGWLLNRYQRRLPVFFMLDASQDMKGTFEVTMQAGLDKLRFALLNQRMDTGGIDMTIITFGKTTKLYKRESLQKFTKPIWHAQGQCVLQPAFSCLIDAFESTIVASNPARPGDYPPLVFLILGSRPCDLWQAAVGTLATFIDNRRPLFITLLIPWETEELGREYNMISHTVLSLQQAKAEYLTQFFVWVSNAITKVLESYTTEYSQGRALTAFPILPALSPSLVSRERY